MRGQATLSGAIDVVVVEQENGELACSPFHVRFGKFSLILPSEKKVLSPNILCLGILGLMWAKVDFFVNGDKVDYAMKVGEGGEAFFVFQTDGDIPEDMQTSPVVSPVVSPVLPDASSSVTTTSPLGPCF
jgi:phosphatidate phosphatase LPIN